MAITRATIGRRFLAIAGRLHVGVYRATRGRRLNRMGRLPVLVLTTRGRRSNRLVAVPLLFLEDGGDLVITGTVGGSPRPPAWWLNLQAHPEGTVQIGASTWPVRAEEVTGADKERLYDAFVAGHRNYAGYRGKTTRDIPVIRLRRP